MPFLDQPATLMPTGLYEYDLGERAASDAAQARLQSGLRAPVFGSGGIQGSVLQRRQGLEDAFARAVQEAQRRRSMQEIARRAQEADLGKLRRAQALQAGAGAIGNVTTGVTAGLFGNADFRDSFLQDPKKKQPATQQPDAAASTGTAFA